MSVKCFNYQGKLRIQSGLRETQFINIDMPLQISLLDETRVIGELEVKSHEDIVFLFRYLADKLEKYLQEEGKSY